jgi:hypothetical protein
MKKVTTVKHVKASQIEKIIPVGPDHDLVLVEGGSICHSVLGNSGAGLPIPGDYVIDYTREDGSNPYLGWCPKEVFERSVCQSVGVAGLGSFSWALMRLKEGAQVKRSGWNGKNQFIFMIKGEEFQRGLKFGYGEYEGEPTIVGGLAIKTTANQIQVGWLASQSDMLADDWEEIE